MRNKIIFSILFLYSSFAGKAQLYVTTGETITVSTSGDLNLQEDLNNNGIITNLTLGAGNAQNISGTGTINTLIVNKSAGTATGIEGMQTITTTITPTAGILAANGFLTLASTLSGSASISQGSGSYLSGNVTIQRYIGSSAQWRMIGFPFTQATAISEGSLAGFYTSGYNAYTYNEAADDETHYGNSGAANAGWTGFTTGTISSSQGILINGGTPTSTINFTGPVNTGTTLIALTKSKNGWNFIANPFPSNINWTTIASNNSSLVNNAIYRYDPSSTAYATYVSGSSTGRQSNVIENGASFFVQATAAGNLSIAETDKTTSAPLASLMGIGTQRATLTPDGVTDAPVTNTDTKSIIKLYLSKEGDLYADEAVIRWGIDPATDNFDGKYDAYDMGRSVGPDLSVVGADGTIYSIFHGSALQTKDKEQRVIALGVKNMESGSYIINSKLLSAMYDGNEVYLLDHYTNQTTLVSADSASYSFNVTSDPGSASVSRFSIAFNYKAKLDIPANDIRLLNNPSSLNQFNIVLGADYQKLNWELVDNSGRVLQSGLFSGVTKETVNTAQTNNLSSGSYFIKLIGDGKSLTTQKWIKQ
jgi:hypothetical protein